MAADLRKKGARIPSFQGGRSRGKTDITSPKKVKDLLKGKGLGFVFHLAGMTGVQQSWEMTHKYFKVNVVGTYNMLDALHEREHGNMIPFVFTSSSSVYGLTFEGVISEDNPPVPINPYALTKVAAEALCRSFWSTFGLATLIVRPFYVAGPGLSRGVIHELTHKIALAEVGLTVGGVVRVTDPEVIIDVVDVRDCIEALETIATGGRAGDVYNVCSGKGCSIREIAEIIMSSSQAKLNLVTTGARRPADIPRLVGNPAKLRGLGWSGHHALEETLASMLDACRVEVKAQSGGTRSTKVAMAS